MAVLSIQAGSRSANVLTTTRLLTKDPEEVRKLLGEKGLDPTLVDAKAKAYVYLEERSKGHRGYRLSLDTWTLTGTTANLGLKLVDTSVDGFFQPDQSAPWMLLNLADATATAITVNVNQP